MQATDNGDRDQVVAELAIDNEKVVYLLRAVGSASATTG